MRVENEDLRITTTTENLTEMQVFDWIQWYKWSDPEVYATQIVQRYDMIMIKVRNRKLRKP